MTFPQRNRTMSRRGKTCAECRFSDETTFYLSDDRDYAAVLEHYLDEHPDSSLLEETVQGSFVEVLCEDCEQPFFSPVSLVCPGSDERKLSVEAYCPECVDRGFARKLFGKQISAIEFVENEAEPLEDGLGDRTESPFVSESKPTDNDSADNTLPNQE